MEKEGGRALKGPYITYNLVFQKAPLVCAIETHETAKSSSNISSSVQGSRNQRPLRRRENIGRKCKKDLVVQ